MPRRASAYDVFAGAPGGLPTVAGPPMGRRASFRVAPPTPVEQQSPPTENDAPCGIPLIAAGVGAVPSIEERRMSCRRASHMPLPALEDLEAAPRRQASVDAEGIRIVIHDVDSGATTGVQKRVLLKKDPNDKTHRTRGFGMRVVGGKTAADGRLFAYIVWTVPSGPAEKGGLQQGDKVLEWDGVSLVDRSFEEVCAIMDRTGETVELLVEHATELRMCDILDDPIPMASYAASRKASDASAGPSNLYVDPDNENGPASPTRRKLPKTPEQIAAAQAASREQQQQQQQQLLHQQQPQGITGRIQIQVWYHDERKELVVAVLAADDLAPRDETLGFGNLPEAYARLSLVPKTSEDHCVQTEVAPASRNPIWNANLSFPNVAPEELAERQLEIALWDLVPRTEHSFLGGCAIDLQKAFLDDRAVWCRLDDWPPPNSMQGGRSPHTSPRGSIVSGGIDKRGDFGNQRSVSDDVDSIGECASLLHPDRAWGSRRGSSQSEQLETEVYELGKDFSRSLPGSRRSSFQSIQEQQEEKPAVPPPPSYSRDRRRSSCTRMLRDPEEILKSLKAVKGELGRTMSLTGDKKHRKSASGPSGGEDCKEDTLELGEVGREFASPPSSPERASPPQLGPGQIKPKGYRFSTSQPPEIKLGLLMTKGQLEVEVVCARRIPSHEAPPDTYVKCYLRDQERWLQKKKTRIAKHSFEPQFRQTLKYQACDILGRSLVVMLWERQGGFEHNQGLGGAEVALDALTLTHLTTGWYPLFPIQFLGSDSNDSP
nr:unnamed protein product [Callosobruchus chinensis]